MSDARSDIFARIREALKVKAPKPHLKGEPVAGKTSAVAKPWLPDGGEDAEALEPTVEVERAPAGELPPDERPTVRHQIRLAKAKAKVEMLDVAGAIADLSQLLKESAAVDGEDGATTRAVRETLGKAFFYATSLLKANGATEEEWRPYAERTRQVFRYLAEHQDPAALADYERRVEAEFTRSLGQQSL